MKGLDILTVRVEFFLIEIKPFLEFVIRDKKYFFSLLNHLCYFSFRYYGNDGRDYNHLSYEQPYPGKSDCGQAHVGEFLQQPHFTA